MKHQTASALAILSLIGAFDASAAEPETSLSYNAGAVTDYRYRGISQTRLKPALQAGVDYARGGFYAGAWGSTIQWIKDSGASEGPVELDLYGGYKGSVDDVSYDVGLLRYQYLNNSLGRVAGFANADTTEVYGALTYGVVTAKYSHSLSNLFGNLDSKGSGYLDLSAAFDLGSGYQLTPHVGRQLIRNNGQFSYTDYSLTLAKDLGDGLSVSATAVGTSTDAYVHAASGRNLGRSGLVLGLKYAF